MGHGGADADAGSPSATSAARSPGAGQVAVREEQAGREQQAADGDRPARAGQGRPASASNDDPIIRTVIGRRPRQPVAGRATTSTRYSAVKKKMAKVRSRCRTRSRGRGESGMRRKRRSSSGYRAGAPTAERREQHRAGAQQMIPRPRRSLPTRVDDREDQRGERAAPSSVPGVSTRVARRWRSRQDDRRDDQGASPNTG